MALQNIWEVRFTRGHLPYKIAVLASDVHGALGEGERLIEGIYVIVGVHRTDTQVSV